MSIFVCWSVDTSTSAHVLKSSCVVHCSVFMRIECQLAVNDVSNKSPCENSSCHFPWHTLVLCMLIYSPLTVEVIFMRTTLTKPTLILVPSVDIFKMSGDIKAPAMDWSMADRTAAYKLFKQKAPLYCDCKDIKTEKQVSYILLMTGNEGVHMFNSWGLEGDDVGKAKDPGIKGQCTALTTVVNLIMIARAAQMCILMRWILLSIPWAWKSLHTQHWMCACQAALMQKLADWKRTRELKETFCPCAFIAGCSRVTLMWMDFHWLAK